MLQKPYNDPTSSSDLTSIKTSNSKQHIIDTFGVPSTVVQANSTSPFLSSSDLAVIVKANKQQKQRSTESTATATAATTADKKHKNQDIAFAGQSKTGTLPLSTLAR